MQYTTIQVFTITSGTEWEDYQRRENKLFLGRAIGYLDSNDLLLCIDVCQGVGEMYVSKALRIYKKFDLYFSE